MSARGESEVCPACSGVGVVIVAASDSATACREACIDIEHAHAPCSSCRACPRCESTSIVYDPSRRAEVCIECDAEVSRRGALDALKGAAGRYVEDRKREVFTRRRLDAGIHAIVEAADGFAAIALSDYPKATIHFAHSAMWLGVSTAKTYNEQCKAWDALVAYAEKLGAPRPARPSTSGGTVVHLNHGAFCGSAHDLGRTISWCRSGPRYVAVFVGQLARLEAAYRGLRELSPGLTRDDFVAGLGPEVRCRFADERAQVRAVRGAA